MGRIFLSSTNTPPFIPFSMGDYTNPITAKFTLHDTKQPISQTLTVYLVAEDIYSDLVRLEKAGVSPTVDIFFSTDTKNWFKNQLSISNLDAINTTKVIPIYIKFQTLDDISIFPNASIINIRDFKIRLIY